MEQCWCDFAYVIAFPELADAGEFFLAIPGYSTNSSILFDAPQLKL